MNGGVDVVDLEPLLAGMGHGPGALELPVPGHPREARAAELAERAAALAARAPPDAQPLGWRAGAAGGGAAGGSQGRALTWSSAAVTAAMHADSQRAMEAAAVPAAPAAGSRRLPAAAATEAGAPAGGSPAAPGAGDALPRDEESWGAAAVRIQAAARGWLARRRVARQRREERAFLSMSPPAAAAASGGCSRRRAEEEAAAAQRVEALMAQRRAQQAERSAEYEAGLAAAARALREREGPAMRRGMDERLHSWLESSRDPVTGDYPDLPTAEQGGSAALPEPQAQPPPSRGAAPGARPGTGRRPPGTAGAGSGRRGSRGAQCVRGVPVGASSYLNVSPTCACLPAGSAASPAPRPSPLFLEEVRQAVRQYRETWQGHHAKGPDPSTGEESGCSSGLDPACINS